MSKKKLGDNDSFVLRQTINDMLAPYQLRLITKTEAVAIFEGVKLYDEIYDVDWNKFLPKKMVVLLGLNSR